MLYKALTINEGHDAAYAAQIFAPIDHQQVAVKCPRLFHAASGHREKKVETKFSIRSSLRTS